MSTTKYFAGPEGLYYNKKHDLIYQLEYTGAQIRNIRDPRKFKKFLGYEYIYRDAKNNGFPCAIHKNAKDDIFLGAL